MKETMLMLLLAGATLCATAQTKTVTGTVIDKKTGNPLPGARVEATGGAETTETDADGTFSLEVPRYLKKMTATYPGMRDKSLKLEGKDNLLFQLKTDKDSHWFVNIDTGFELNGSAYSGLWFFGQQKKNWGWFVKFGSDVSPDYDERDLSLIAGAIKNVSFNKTPLYVYLGAGYGHGWWHSSNTGGPVIYGGVMYRWRHLNLNGGLSLRAFDSFTESSTGLHIGVGYAW